MKTNKTAIALLLSALFMNSHLEAISGDFKSIVKELDTSIDVTTRTFEIGICLGSMAKNLEIGIRNKYTPKEFDELVKEAADGEIYKNIGQFVGRIEARRSVENVSDEKNNLECKNGLVATGTVVSYDGMPDNLLGRVVISVAHIHPNFQNGAICDEITPDSVEGGVVYLDRANIKQAEKKEEVKEEKLEECMYFTPDFPEKGAYKYRGRGKIETSIPIIGCYSYKCTDDTPPVLVDIAIFILETPVRDKESNIIKGIKLDLTNAEEQPKIDIERQTLTGETETYLKNQVFSVGYGRPEGIELEANTDLEKKILQKAIEISGFNVKKTTNPNIVTKKTQCVGEGTDYILGCADPLKFGPGDSGSLVIRQSDSSVLGVFFGSGGAFHPMPINRAWIKIALEDAARKDKAREENEAKSKRDRHGKAKQIKIAVKDAARKYKSRKENEAKSKRDRHGKANKPKDTWSTKQ